MEIKDLRAGDFYFMKTETSLYNCYRYSGRKDENGNPIFYQVIGENGSEFVMKEIVLEEEQCKYLIWA